MIDKTDYFTSRFYDTQLKTSRGGVLSEKLEGGGEGVCGPLPKTLTLFMSKICVFTYPIYDLKIKVASSKNLPSSRTEGKNHTLFMTKMAKIYTLLMTKTAEQPYSLGSHAPI